LAALVLGLAAPSFGQGQRVIEHLQSIELRTQTPESLPKAYFTEISSPYSRSRGYYYRLSELQNCIDAQDHVASTAGELSYYAMELASCAERTTYSDDCYREFQETRRAQSDHQSAISRVKSYCDQISRY